MNEPRDIAGVRPIEPSSAFRRVRPGVADAGQSADGGAGGRCVSVAGAIGALMVGLQVGGPPPRRG